MTSDLPLNPVNFALVRAIEQVSCSDEEPDRKSGQRCVKHCRHTWEQVEAKRRLCTTVMSYPRVLLSVTSTGPWHSHQLGRVDCAELLDPEERERGAETEGELASGSRACRAWQRGLGVSAPPAGVTVPASLQEKDPASRTAVISRICH
ncbi:unnamed protein product [Pleuronectes platessa]|uniref:Uncharacterized protein n=1 Tax=Pleuronectes platessa TaxID=8262 RepID=A0A9N7YZS4_PLEPL|nr:unnamed protein product [Pleuronectes platessa]